MRLSLKMPKLSLRVSKSQLTAVNLFLAFERFSWGVFLLFLFATTLFSSAESTVGLVIWFYTGVLTLLALQVIKRILLKGEHLPAVPYDVLVLSTGAAPIVPPIEGLERESVRARCQVLRNVPDVDAITALVDGGARTAVVLGAGFIGLEMTEALVHRDVHVTLVDLADQVLAPLDPEMARTVQSELVRAGVDVRLGVSATSIDDTVQEIRTTLPAA